MSLFPLTGTAQPTGPQTSAAATGSGPWAEGEARPGQWQAASGEISAMNVRVARVTSRSELPGGPWADGQVGDYVLENPQVTVIVRGEDRPAVVETPGTGCIVDIADRRGRWDLFGGLFHAVRLNGESCEVRYNEVRITPPVDDKSPPFLSCRGVTTGAWSVPVVTILRLEPNLPHLVVLTRVFNNTAAETLETEIIDRPNWGTLPVFVSGHGYPLYTRTLSMRTSWVCGLLNDTSIGFANNSGPSLDLLMLLGNRASLRYAEPIEVEPGHYTDASRTIVISQGDMTSLVAYHLLVSGMDRGTLRGVVKEKNTERVTPGAEVWVRTLHKDAETGRVLIRPFAIGRTDNFGQYQLPLPVGEYEVQARTVGREPAPYVRLSNHVEQGAVVDQDILTTAASHFLFEVVDADSGRPLPARVDFEANGSRDDPDLGPDWHARGCRSSAYLAPGPTAVIILPGEYTCTFSRGPEYNTVTRKVTLGGKKGVREVKVALEHVLATPNMISADLRVATDASPWSRSRPEDVILAAAGEGLDWIVSGDLGQVTDLQTAIESLGLRDYIKASAGVQLSFQYPKLFGGFYLFPIPADTTTEDLEALAGPETTPREFFANVHAAFPEALVTVTDASFANASYLHYCGFDAETGEAASDLFSTDFDAILTHQTDWTQVHKYPWNSLLALTWQGRPKIPLAASCSSSLYYEPLGYPRLYLIAPEGGNPDEWNDTDRVYALRERRFFITNGPIIEREVNGELPTDTVACIDGQFGEKLRVLGAPWVEVNAVLGKLGDLNRRVLRMSPTSDLVKFPRSEETGEPYIWVLKTREQDTGITRYNDNFVHVEVQGGSYDDVVRSPRARGAQAFAVTPPCLVDANSDGAIDLSWRKVRAPSESPEELE